MEILEIADKLDEESVNYIFSIASKSEYTKLSKDYIKSYIEDKCHKVVVIRELKEIVGFLIYFILYEEIDIIFIATYPNDRGYGRELLSYLFNEAKRNNIESVKLDLNENNDNAKKFYIRNGFNIIAKRKRYYDNKSDALIMERIFV